MKTDKLQLPITSGLRTQDLNKALKNVPYFMGTFPRDSIPKVSRRPAAFIINTDSKNEPGEHWEAIILKEKEEGEYFDSFGLPPLHPAIQSYVRNNCSNGFKYNSTCLQSPQSSSCGMYAADFIRSRWNGDSMERFLAYFSSNLEKNDQIISDRCRGWITS